MNNKLNLEKLLNKIKLPQRKLCKNLLKDFEKEIINLPGSKTKHQAWSGGYKDHLEETMNIAQILYRTLNSKRKLEFSLSGSLFTLFIHDFDKIFRYTNNKQETRNFDLFFKDYLYKKYKYRLSKEEFNALKYIHGENTDYHPTKKIMLPLTAFVHCCDIISSRIWFDRGKNEKLW